MKYICENARKCNIKKCYSRTQHNFDIACNDKCIRGVIGSVCIPVKEI